MASFSWESSASGSYAWDRLDRAALASDETNVEDDGLVEANSDCESDEEALTLPARMFLGMVVYMHLSGHLSARQACILCHWAKLAGVRGPCW